MTRGTGLAPVQVTALVDQGRSTSARTVLDHLLRLFPDEPRALALLARLGGGDTWRGRILASGGDDAGMAAGIVLGRAFAFVTTEALESMSPGLRTALGPPAALKPRVVPLLGTQAVTLPGHTVAPLPLPALRLAVVTSDKSLYREGRDRVHLLALDPFSPGAEVTLEIAANGAPFARRPVTLDAHGAALVTLRELPAGEYAVRFADDPEGAVTCELTVAEYHLAPLVASIAERRLEGAARLALTLRLESFGVPVDGAVRAELLERGRRVAEQHTVATAGLARLALELSGDGPHAVSVQLVAQPSRTATVPLVGSRKAERSDTLLCPLGTQVTASLLPSAGARMVRGLWLTEGATVTTPFRLERVDARRARLQALVAARGTRLVVVDPAVPAPQPGAVDPRWAQHPATVDVAYREAEELFRQERFEDAARAFEAARRPGQPLHPNYAYFAACA